MDHEKTVIIGGGVGPMAGVFFHKKIIQNTNGAKGDKGQLDVVHVSQSRRIAERMAFLGGEASISPAIGMYQSVKLAAIGLEEMGMDAIISVPCNTFHAPLIFDEFLKLLKNDGINYEVLNIIDETVRFITGSDSTPKTVGVLGTIGTREHRIFHAAFEKKAIEVIDITMERQNDVRDLILRIKRENRVTPEHISELQEFISTLATAGADVVILGCTELSMIVDQPISSAVPYIDPMMVLARTTVEKCGGPEMLAEV